MTFQKAERKKAKLRLWLNGMSSSGKTFAALLIAKGLGGKTALIDSEAGRGNLYGGKFDYDICELDAPYTVDKYIKAIREAEQAKYDNIIIDSSSHEWLEVLSEKSRIDERGGNQFTNWNKPTQKHNSFVEAIIQSPCHVIVTSRAKRDWVMEEETKNGRSVQVPKLVGLASVQREGFEYEATVEFRIDRNHYAEAVKDNTGIWLGKEPHVITEEDGRTLKEWLESGREYVPPCVRCRKDGRETDSIGGSYTESGHYLCEPCLNAYRESKANKPQINGDKQE